MRRLLFIFVCTSVFLNVGYGQSSIAGRYTDSAVRNHCGQRVVVPATLTLQNEVGSSEVTGQLLLVAGGRIEQAEFEGEFSSLSFLTGIAYVESGDYLVRVNLGLTEGRLEGYITSLQINVCNEGTSNQFRSADNFVVKFER